jgi:hypothetical protein
MDGEKTGEGDDLISKDSFRMLMQQIREENMKMLEAKMKELERGILGTFLMRCILFILLYYINFRIT